MNTTLFSNATTTTRPNSAVTKGEANLGWAAMPSFPSAVNAQDVSLGWDAMQAFGKADAVSGDAELVANFVRSTRLADTVPSALASFWSHMSILCIKA